MKTKKLVENQFDQIMNIDSGKKYDFSTKNMGRRDRKIVSALVKSGIDGKKVLDVGPGTGRWLTFVKENNAKYLSAVDISQIAIDNVTKLCNEAYKLDIENDKFPFENDSFDIIVCFMVMEHIVDPNLLISEIVRLSKPGGLILITIPNIVSLASRVRMLLGYLPIAVSSDKTHVRYYTKREFRKMFKYYSLYAEQIPTSFSLNPFNTKQLRVASNRLTKSFDDHLLIRILNK
jgi:SAM-dependent methyltransferase